MICTRCNGKGKTLVCVRCEKPRRRILASCPDCDGTGVVADGNGWKPARITVIRSGAHVTVVREEL